MEMRDIAAILFFTQLALSDAITATGFMTHYYRNHKPVTVNNSLILELTPGTFLSDRPSATTMHCDVNVVTSSSQRLLIHFLSLEISFESNQPDRLHIFDYRSNGEAVRISPPQGLYGLFESYYYTGKARGVEDFMSTANRLKLDYTGRPSLAYDGFKIVITAFKDADGGCGRGFARCKLKPICIPVSTWCDGYRNCGIGDNSDEADCEVVMTTGWDSSYGTTTAVLAASLACAAFLLSIAVVVYVVFRLNRRDEQKHSITVRCTKRQRSANGDLARLYAPPSYEVVIGMHEDPPPYQAIANKHSSISEDEDEDVIHEHMLTTSGATAASITDAHDVIETAQMGRHGKVCVTSALVTRDVEGNAYQTECSTSGESIQSDHLECSMPTRDPRNKRVSINDKIMISEIEVLSSEDSDDTKDENSNKSKQCNGSYARISYHRSPSKREAANIEFIDNTIDEI